MKSKPFTCVAWTSFAATAAVLSLWAACVARAEPPILEFLSELRGNDLGEVALDYLEILKKRSDVPVAVREVFDLELGNAYLMAARETQHRELKEQRTAAAKTHLDKFLKEHGEHPQAFGAYMAMADFETQRGHTALRMARSQKEKEKQAPFYDEAKQAFEASRPVLERAVERAEARLKKLRPKDAAEEKKMMANKKELERLDEATMDFLELRGKLALVDYNVAQTIPDPKSAARQDALKKASKALDKIYQEEKLGRIGLTATGLFAHMWHGKVTDELGDFRLALDIYDEVLANAPEDAERGIRKPRGKKDADDGSSALEPLFAQVEYFRMLILVKQKKFTEFIKEATEWLASHDKAKKTNGYQGIAFELAKALGAEAEAKPDQARELKRDALKLLTAMATIDSEFRDDAMVLKRLMGEKDAAITGFEEAVALGNAAIESNQMAEAIDYLQQADTFAEKDPKVKVDDAIKVKHKLAQVYWMTGKLNEAATLAESIMLKYPQNEQSPAAASVAISAAKTKYFGTQEATEKDKALVRLAKIADYTIKTWPGRAEADDARIAPGQANLVRQEFDKALAAFNEVTPQSSRYPNAVYQSAVCNWQLHAAEDRKGPDQRDAEVMKKFRAEAEKYLLKSREMQRAKLPPGEPLPDSLVDAELLLAEVMLEGNRPAEAIALLDPLLESAKSGNFDQKKLRMCVAAVRSCLAVKDFAKAGKVTETLLESGEDTLFVNKILVNFARMVGSEVKRVKAEVITADAQTKKEAEKKLKDSQDLFGKMLQQLAGRQRQSIPDTMYLGEACADNGFTDKARELFTILLERAANEKGSVEPKAKIRIRAKLIGLLRDEGSFDKALPEVEKLIADTGGKALEPLVEKGLILQARAESAASFDVKLFDEALIYWTQLRLKLQGMKPPPPEFYQLIYKTAACLMVQAEFSKNKEKAVQASQVLNSVLQLNRSALPPDLEASYDDLAAKAKKLQTKLGGGKPAADAPKTVATSTKPGEKPKPGAAPAPKDGGKPGTKPATPTPKDDKSAKK